MCSRCRPARFLLCRRWTRPRIPNRQLGLAAGNWLGRGQGPFWQPPLYPYFLGLIKLAFPESFYYVARFVQALIGSLTCVLLYLVGQRLFGSGIGFVGGLIAAVYGPLIYFDARLLPASLATLLTLVSILLLMRSVERPTRSIFMAAGFALGLASLYCGDSRALDSGRGHLAGLLVSEKRPRGPSLLFCWERCWRLRR